MVGQLLMNEEAFNDMTPVYAHKIEQILDVERVGEIYNKVDFI